MKVGAGSMIELMKFDMGGCAAVLGCAKAIAQLRPKVANSSPFSSVFLQLSVLNFEIRWRTRLLTCF